MWDKTGTIVQLADNDQYVVKIHGSNRVTLRNRKYLPKVETPTARPHLTPAPAKQLPERFPSTPPSPAPSPTTTQKATRSSSSPQPQSTFTQPQPASPSTTSPVNPTVAIQPHAATRAGGTPPDATSSPDALPSAQSHELLTIAPSIFTK